MLIYILKRLGLAALTLLIILLVSYCLVRLAPGDPAKGTMLGENTAASEGLSDAGGALVRNESLRAKLHLDEPVLIGFGYWLAGVFTHGDFGDSASVDKGRPVTVIIAERLPVTVSLNIMAILVTYLLAIPLGIYSSLRPGGLSDRMITFALFLLYSLPGMWVALILQASVCEGGLWPVFPLKGLEPGDITGKSTWLVMWETVKHCILPVTCLCYAGFAGLSRYSRAGMLEVTRQDYIRTARAKGLSEFMVVMKHAFRNALIVLITLFAGLLPGLVAGSIIIEHVFSIPGMGSLSMMALTSRDIPLLMALFAFAGGLTLSGILLADIAYVLVDPRISFAKRKN